MNAWSSLPGATSGRRFRGRGQSGAACGDGAVEPLAGSEAVEGGASYNLPVVTERERQRDRLLSSQEVPLRQLEEAVE